MTESILVGLGQVKLEVTMPTGGVENTDSGGVMRRKMLEDAVVLFDAALSRAPNSELAYKLRKEAIRILEAHTIN